MDDIEHLLCYSNPDDTCHRMCPDLPLAMIIIADLTLLIVASTDHTQTYIRIV